MLWDVFCKVIDNHGDLGVAWRLAVQLAAAGDRVRLWIDRPEALAWMAPEGAAGVEAHPWDDAARAVPGDAVVEAFACDPDPAFVAAMARLAQATGRQPPWINLEYLSAEAWVERCHGLPSPVSAGPGRGLLKHFFHPGFQPATGGLLRESDLLDRQARFDAAAWLQGQGVAAGPERRVSVFCYEPPGLDTVLARLASDRRPTRLLVTAGRAEAAVRAWLAGHPGTALRCTWLPLVPQVEFDHLLWACDLNFVRGEDSLVRALWAGRPLVWQIYPQDDGVHLGKLGAFLDWMAAPASLRALHRAWNEGGAWTGPLEEAAWREAVLRGRDRLLGQPGLADQLRGFVERLAAGGTLARQPRPDGSKPG